MSGTTTRVFILDEHELVRRGLVDLVAAAPDLEVVGSAGDADEALPLPAGALDGATAGDVVFYGTLEGFLKAVDADTGEELYRFKTPSGIIGNVMTYVHGGKQYIGVLSGVGGWAGIGLAAGLTNPNEGLGAVGGYASLSQYTELGGQLTVFELPG